MLKLLPGCCFDLVSLLSSLSLTSAIRPLSNCFPHAALLVKSGTTVVLKSKMTRKNKAKKFPCCYKTTLNPCFPLLTEAPKIANNFFIVQEELSCSICPLNPEIFWQPFPASGFTINWSLSTAFI